MTAKCHPSQLWEGDDFSPCFRETFIDGLIPLIILTCSAFLIVKEIWRQRRLAASYTPLTSSTSGRGYGTLDSDVFSFSSSSSESTGDQEEPLPKWSLYDMTRLVTSFLQCAFGSTVLWEIAKDSYILNPGAESSSFAFIRLGYSVHVLYWLYALGASISIVEAHRKSLADKLSTHLIYMVFFDSIVRLVDIRSFYLQLSESSTGLKFTAASFTASFFTLAILIHEVRYRPLRLKSPSGHYISPVARVSLYSKLLFAYLNPLMKEGYKRTLNDDDLDRLPSEDLSKNSHAYYDKCKVGTMGWSLAYALKELIIPQYIFAFIWTLAMFGPPYCLNKIVTCIENPTEASSLTGFFYALGLFASALVQSLSYQQSLHIGRIMYIRMQSVIIGEVYNKSLRRKEEQADDKDESAKGNVNNLLSIDAEKISTWGAYTYYLVCFPLQVGISTIALYRLLGVAALYGVGIVIIFQAVNYKLNLAYRNVRRKVMGLTDKRIKLTNELLGAIRIIKFFSWEKEFRQNILGVRQDEIKAFQSSLYVYMCISTLIFFAPMLMVAAVFYVYTLNNELTASTAFTALALFNTFRSALDELPMIISWYFTATVSLKRVGDFLDQDEVTAVATSVPLNRKTVIGFMDNASFSWKKDAEQPCISGLNLSFPQGKMSLICGPTGSGKTSLLASLMGETYCMSGSAVIPRQVNGQFSGIAYVAQTAWLQNKTIRDNVLFGLPFDEERYETVLSMCALEKDLQIFEHGDQTEIGERGITLSGGQKQRVAIARAVYSHADIVILDDCLSAVDAHTARYLYERCLIGDLLRNRTIILVTHHVGLCIRGADYVVAMRNGKVEASGSPANVIASGVLGEEFASQDTTPDEEDTTSSTSTVASKNVEQKAPSKKAKPSFAGDGKLVQDEKRAEGSVTWETYGVYFFASGGFLVWLGVIALFMFTQFSTVSQDYWIKVWSSAYGHVDNTTVTAASAFQALGNIPYMRFGEIPQKQDVDAKFYLGVYILIGVLSAVFFTARQALIYTASLIASKRLHEQLLDRILRAKVRFFDTTPVGRIINRFSSDMETIDQSIATSLVYVFFSGIAGLTVIIVISSVIPIFLIPGVFIAALFWWIGTYYLETSRDLKRLNAVSRSPIYVQFSESIGGAATIRAFGCQKRFINENHEKVDNNNRPFIWMWESNRWLHARVEIVGALVSSITGFTLLLFGSSVDSGLAGLALTYSFTFTRSIIWLVRMYAMFEMNCNSVERIQEYLEVEQEPPEHTVPVRETWPETGSVKVENLVMQYAPDTPAVLHGVTFETKPREKIGIVGRTGSGKSTLALSLFRFMEATSGSITIDGLDISTLGLQDLRSRLTIIPQDPVLFTGTLRSNLDPFSEHDDAELYAALKRAQLPGVESLDAQVSENGSNWSQGQRQLIALARALVKKSSLIILDEATSSVDFDTDHAIQETIRRELTHASLLCIAHRIRTVADYDRILVLDQGRVVEFETPYALMTCDKSLFRQMCERSGEYDELLAIAKQKHDSE